MNEMSDIDAHMDVEAKAEEWKLERVFETVGHFNEYQKILVAGKRCICAEQTRKPFVISHDVSPIVLQG